MQSAPTYLKTGTKRETATKLNKDIFGLTPNHELIAQAYRTYLANGRAASAKTLKRGQVSGGGKKPWRQKGTGRARVGSIRVPNWRGGGVVFGPTGDQNFSLKMPQRMKRAAIRQALSLQAEAGHIAIIEEFVAAEGRTKSAVALLASLGYEGTVVLVVDSMSDLLDRATRNIAGLTVVTAQYLNVYTVVNADQLIITSPALNVIDNWLGGDK